MGACVSVCLRATLSEVGLLPVWPRSAARCSTHTTECRVRNCQANLGVVWRFQFQLSFFGLQGIHLLVNPIYQSSKMLA